MTTLSVRWRHWYLRALPAYWIFLFCTTHFPRLRLDRLPEQSDKVLHFAAFGGLAFLFWRAFEAAGSARAGSFAIWATMILAAYAGLDEYLQQFVGRSSDWTDFGCDAAGIVAAMLILETLRRRSARRERRSRPITSSQSLS
ncbi:MAG: VanZ family protein [Planctomycetes bacterium]|nr:VanZ family protein [Planctomycetota bacterium]